MIAMPSDGLWGDGSGFLNAGGADAEMWIMEDVPAAAALIAPTMITEPNLFLAGLSMGGYGALRLGAKYAPRVSGISIHSSITHVSQMIDFAEEPLWITSRLLRSKSWTPCTGSCITAIFCRRSGSIAGPTIG